jgi:hypothetical protein
LSTFLSLPTHPTSAARRKPTNDGFSSISTWPICARPRASPPASHGPRLRAAILGAIMTVELDLRAYAAAQIAAGHATLAAVPAPQLDGQSVQILRYTRAVALYAKAELIERHRDYDLTSAGTHQAEDLAPAIDERRDAQHAVRDLTGRTRTVVDLI